MDKWSASRSCFGHLRERLVAVVIHDSLRVVGICRAKMWCFRPVRQEKQGETCPLNRRERVLVKLGEWVVLVVFLKNQAVTPRWGACVKPPQILPTITFPKPLSSVHANASSSAASGAQAMVTSRTAAKEEQRGIDGGDQSAWTVAPAQGRPLRRRSQEAIFSACPGH
jgi:hypothetical protein